MSFLSGLATQPATLAIGAGLLAGVVTGGAVVASGALSSPPPPELALVSCPGSDTVVARVASGTSMLVTARSADGSWLELYIGEPGVDSGWAPTTALHFDAAADQLPVDDCASSVALASLGPVSAPPPTPELTFAATVEPVSLPPGVTPSPTPVPTPTPKPTPTKSVPPGVTPPPPTPTPTPSPTPTPLPPPPTIPPPTPTPTPMPTVNPGPSLSSLTASYQTFCTTGYSDITVTATDPQGVDHVTITYTPTGGPTYGPTLMNSIGSNMWRYRITPLGWSEGFISITVTAYDNFGAWSSLSNVDNIGSPSSLYTTSFC